MSLSKAPTKFTSQLFKKKNLNLNSPLPDANKWSDFSFSFNTVLQLPWDQFTNLHCSSQKISSAHLGNWVELPVWVAECKPKAEFTSCLLESSLTRKNGQNNTFDSTREKSMWTI